MHHTGIFKIMTIVAIIAIAGGVIEVETLNGPFWIGGNNNGVTDSQPAGDASQTDVPPETDTTNAPEDAPAFVPIDISGMIEITGVTIIDVSGSYYIDGRTIAADSGAAIDITADEVLIVIKGDCTVTSETTDAIRVLGTSTLTIQGYDPDSTLTVAGATVSGAGSGIGNVAGNVGEINIVDLNRLTATGNGVHGYAIGGDRAAVNITDSHIISAIGGQLQTKDGTYLGIYIDKKGKGDTEGGAGIGGSNITITGTTIDLAVGGSKAAGIGARFWQATSISITDSTITDVYGGAGSAAIGGSREVSGASAKDQDITIMIENSSIRAFGGENGAGIGSGYDVNCGQTKVDGHPVQWEQGECHIEIMGDSVISATGGAYAAGIGTGFHQGNLTGSIASTVTLDVVSGSKDYGNYSLAQDIGYGVVDESREGLWFIDHGIQFTVAGELIANPFA